MIKLIEDLEQIYLQKKKIIKRLPKWHQNTSGAVLLEKLLELNYQILESAFMATYDQIIKSGIKDTNSQKYLIELMRSHQHSVKSQSGIIPLLIYQNEFLATMIEKFNHQNLIEYNTSQSNFLKLFQKERQLYRRFLKDFQAIYQEKLSLSVIGFGEISTVLNFSGGRTFSNIQPEREKWVYKKMPIFPDMEEVNKFTAIFKEYRRLFTEEIGISIPDQRIQVHPVAAGKIRLYVLQKKCDAQAIGNKLIQFFNVNQCSTLLEMILGELKKVWTYNQSHQTIKVAIDGQISNWVVDNFDPENDKFTGREKLLYIDTSSPLYRIDGQEQLNPELFLKSTPFFLRPIIRALFLQEVLDRYYDLHLVTVDLIANFFKEGKAEFIPEMIETANKFFATQMTEFNIEPITEKEVTKYYKNDAFIWRFYLAARKVDRFITEKILRKKYEFRLPEKVQR